MSSISIALFIFGSVATQAATFTVANTADSGSGSLRQAILDSNVNGEPDTIVFDTTVFSTPRTIVLTSGMLMIERDNALNMPPRSLTIDGPGAHLLTISGNSVSRVISIERQAKAIISGIKVTGGNGVGGTEYSGSGGGILVKGGFTGEDLLILRDSILTGNAATGPGGGLSVNGNATITNCTINANVALAGGGLATGTSSQVRVLNSTISGNSADWAGGGVYNQSATIDFVNTTVAFNTGTVGTSIAGGIFETTQSPLSVTTRLRNSIVANNRLGLMGLPGDFNGRLTSEGNNIIGTTTGIIEIIGTTTGNQLNTNPHIDPLLLPNGGITPTHALFPTSTAIDTGNNCVLSTPADGGCLDPNIRRDQRGVIRPQDGNGDGNAVVDIGPYEIIASVVATPGNLDLLPSSDSGTSNSDNITNIRELSFSVASVIAGATIEFSRDGTLLSTVVASGTSISLNDPNAPANGTFAYRVRQRVGTDWSSYSILNVTVDTTAPSITINQAATQADPTAILPVNFTATISESVVEFDQSDISLAGSTADVSNAIVGVTATSSPFSIEVNGIGGIGTVVVSIPSTRFQDFAGNVNSASSSSDNSVTYDPSPPSPIEFPRIDPHFSTGRGFDDDVLDIVQQPDGKVIAVGQFESGVGMPFKRIIRLDQNGNVDTTFNAGTGANDEIRQVVLQEDGKIVVAGNFTSFNDVARGKIARLLPDGSLDMNFAVGPGVSASRIINALEVTAEGKILIGGDFFSYDGVLVNKLARLNTDGTLDQTFTGGSNTGDGSIRYMVVQPDGKIFAGGTSFFPQPSVFRLLASGAIDPDFVPSNDDRLTAIIHNGSIFLGGPSGVTKLQPNGLTDIGFVPQAVNSVSSIAVQNDGKVVLSGQFPGSPSRTVTRLNANGSLDPLFNTAETDPINSIILTSDGKVLCGGYMRQQNTSIGGANRSGVRRLNADGTRDNSYLTRTGATNGSVNKVVPQPDGKLMVYGDFTTVGGLDRVRLSRLNADGTTDANFVPAFNDMSTFAVQADGKVIVGGNRFVPEGTHQLRRLNVDGSLDPTFAGETATPNGAASNVRSIVAQPDGKVIVVGSFEAVNGQAKKSIVRLLSNGTIDSTFTPNLSFTTADIKFVSLKNDGKILLHGRFTSGSSVNLVAQLSSNGIADWGHITSHPVSDVSPQSDGRVLVVGNFTNVGGVGVSNVARISATGTVDASFTPPVFGPTGATVNTVLALGNGKALVAGGFNLVNGVSVPAGFIRLQSDGRLDPSFTTASNTVLSIFSLALQSDGKIVFAGGFNRSFGVLRDNISRLLPLTKPKVNVFDFDGDQKTDLSVFRPNGASSEWWWNRSSNGGNSAVVFGANTDTIVPSDYTGDGKTDVAFWRPSNGNWFVLRSEDFSFFAAPFGANGDVPVPGDYDGDGKSDLAVFRPATLNWFINKSSGGTDILTFGATGDKPAPGDFDGDGKADIAVYRPTGSQGPGASEWWVRRSSNGVVFALQFGSSTDKAVPGDYTGDGKTDVAFWRPSNGNWFVLRSEDLSFFAFPFGANGDTVVPGDYDGDGRWDAGVFRPSNNTWFIQRSTAGTLIQQFGITGDVPLPSAYVR